MTTAPDPLVERLKVIQAERGLSSREVARLLGTTDATWSRLRAGIIARASREVVERALAAFPELVEPYIRDVRPLGRKQSVTATNKKRRFG